MGLFGGRKTIRVDADVLVIGGGMAGCGATYESRYWGRNLKIVCVEKANIERSGAVAQGLYAINCYMGMRWNENQPEDFVRYASNDLMGLVREDLAYDIGRHVDSTVHKFEEWGLPMMKDPETGRYQREGKWQIMIHGESYKPIVAEAARKAATEVYNRIMVTHLLMDSKNRNRAAGAVGFNVRTGDFYVFRAKAVIVAAGGASHIFKPRSVGEGMGRTWYAPWSNASSSKPWMRPRATALMPPSFWVSVCAPCGISCMNTAKWPGGARPPVLRWPDYCLYYCTEGKIRQSLPEK